MSFTYYFPSEQGNVAYQDSYFLSAQVQCDRSSKLWRCPTQENLFHILGDLIENNSSCQGVTVHNSHP